MVQLHHEVSEVNELKNYVFECSNATIEVSEYGEEGSLILMIPSIASVMVHDHGRMVHDGFVHDCSYEEGQRAGA